MARLTLLQQSGVASHLWPRRSSLGWRSVTFAVALAATGSATAADVSRGPDVVIIAGKDKVVYEFRQNGQLRMVRIVPKWGKPYYLVPRDETEGFGDLERADMLLPRWVIAEF